MQKSRFYTIGVLYYCRSLLWSRYAFLCSRIIFNIWNLKVTVLYLMQNVIKTEQICHGWQVLLENVHIAHHIHREACKKLCAIHKISYIFNYILKFVSKICYQPEATCTHRDVQPLKILLIIILVMFSSPPPVFLSTKSLNFHSFQFCALLWDVLKDKQTQGFEAMRKTHLQTFCVK